MGNLSPDQARDMRESLERLERKLDHIDRLLTGDGEPEKGIIVQFHQVKQSQAMLVKLAWIVFTGFSTALIAMGVKLFTLVPK